MFDATQHSEHKPSRRSYLKAAGVTFSSLALTGVSSASATQYDQTVDIVEAGADPTGEEPIDDVLEQYNRDNIRIEFPDGRYLLNHLSVYKRENFAMVGTGDATLVPGPNYNRDLWIGGGFVQNLRFEGFTIDNSASDTHPQVAFGGADGIVVKDIEKKGYHDGDSTAFGFSAWDEDGHVLVENLKAADGSEPETAVGVYVDTNGTVTFRDCHIEGFGNNGLYASTSSGPVQVEGGVYKNNDISQVRLGSPGSYVRNATIAVDDPAPEHDNSRGVRISDGHGPVTIDNCDIRMERGQGGGGVVGAFSGGSFTLTNSRIYVGPEYSTVGSDGARCADAILVDEATGIDDPGTTTIENTSITGGGDFRSAVCLRRDDNVLRNVCIHQTGTDRAGVIASHGATNNVVEDSNVNVTGDAIVSHDGSVDTADITVSDSCPFPAGMEDRSTSDAEDSVALADAPWPDHSSRLSYATMGTGSGAPTADVFFGFGADGDGEDQQAALIALPEVLGEFVASGELNVRFRPFGVDNDRDRFLADLVQGVWDYEWPAFWEFFAWTYENHEDYDLETYADGREFLADAGVRNYALIAAVAYGGEYTSNREQTADLAGEHGIPPTIPCILLDGDFTWFDRDDPSEQEELFTWIQDRL